MFKIEVPFLSESFLVLSQGCRSRSHHAAKAQFQLSGCGCRKEGEMWEGKATDLSRLITAGVQWLLKRFVEDADAEDGIFSSTANVNGQHGSGALFCEKRIEWFQKK